MRFRSVIQLAIEYDDIYAPPERWDWPALLDLPDPDDVQVSVIEGASPIPAETSHASE